MADIGYLGNPNLKRVGEKIEWTAEMVQEFVKCSEDPVYFAKKYIKIVHVDKGLIPLEMYPYQEEITEKIFNNRRVAVLTSRQAGKTTTAVAVILHYIIFNEFKSVALLANKGDASQEIMSRLQLAYEALPKWMQQGVVNWNKRSIELENGCKVFAAATSSSSIRGKSCNLIYIDEAAFVEGWDEFFQSTYPTISSGETTKLLLTSTPNGLNHFWKTCKGAKEGTNGYEYVEVKWDKVPGRGEKWRQETLQALDFDLQKFAQEYEAEFMGSSGTLISGDCLKTLSPMTPILDKDGLKQYFKPEKDHQYAIIADVSRGKGLDYSAFSVIDFTQMPFVQVAVFRDNFIAPTDYASIIHRLSKMYNEAQIMVEINDIGGQVADTLFLDYGSETMLFTENAGAKGKKIAGGFSGRKVDRGIRTTKTVKNIGCSLLKLLIEQKQLLINDYDTIWELSRFSKKGASYEAEPGAHDDVVMGLVLFAWLSNQQFFKDLNDINTIARLRDRTEQEIEEDLLPFGFIDDGSYVSDDVVIEMTPW
jgi:phenylpyruvate tautomerase PptA (4-oxalocrotonate tautomerase family)